MKIISLILSFFTIFCLSSCKKENSYDEKISQLRETALFYENEDFSIFAYPEKCENPQIDDGIKNDVENRISFKLQFKSKIYENCKIEFNIKDKVYGGDFEYTPLATFLYCKIAVSKLPTDELYLKIDFNGQSLGVKLLSLKNPSTLSYCKILDDLNENDEFVKDFLRLENGEIKIRFIDNDGYDYWYIGFVDGQKITAYLIDGETGEILAIKPEK